MAWKMIGQPKTRKLVRSLAEEYSGMQGVPHDRPLNATRQSVLKAAVDLGRFRTCSWATVHCHETKQMYRANGKHTSTLFASLNGEFPKNLSVIIEHYEADTVEDVANLYATFDTRSSVRLTGDINRIYAACNAELAELSPRFVNPCVTGMAYSLWEDAYAQHSQEDRAQLMLKHPEFVVWFSELLTGLDDKKVVHLRRGAAVAAMFKSWQKSKAAATEFWTAVRDESGAKPTLPDRKLARWLVLSRLHKGQGAAVRATSRETFVRCIHAWNAWRRKEATDLKYYPNKPTPEAK